MAQSKTGKNCVASTHCQEDWKGILLATATTLKISLIPHFQNSLVFQKSLPFHIDTPGTSIYIISHRQNRKL